MKKNKIRLLLPFLLLSGINLNAQTALEGYLAEGLQKNIVLQQKKISLEKALISLKSATSLFLPSIDLLGDYTSGEGGRKISIPVGDMLNPVYSTLNQLTASNAFPQINNVKEDFFPYKFYDVKVRTTMPLLNTDLVFNRQIQVHQTSIKQLEVETYKRELIKEIKVAYFNYLSSLNAVEIYRSSLVLANEGKRVNESLLKNGAGLPVYLLRAESEISSLQAAITEAQNRSEDARKYFNFLLNKELTAQIDTSGAAVHFSEKNFEVNASGREEIRMLSKAVDINRSLLDMNKYFWLPKINAFLDLGAQDAKFKFNNDSRYYLFGVQMSVPIFEGFRNLNKISGAELDMKDAELNLASVRQQLALAASMAWSELESAKKNLTSALKQLSAAQNYHKLINTGYQEGVNSFIETVDARSQLLNAGLLANINRYKLLAAEAKLERETATSNIDK